MRTYGDHMHWWHMSQQYKTHRAQRGGSTKVCKGMPEYRLSSGMWGCAKTCKGILKHSVGFLVVLVNDDGRIYQRPHYSEGKVDPREALVHLVVADTTLLTTQRVQRYGVCCCSKWSLGIPDQIACLSVISRPHQDGGCKSHKYHFQSWMG